MIFTQNARFVFFGDSITYGATKSGGYIDLIKKWLKINYNSLNVVCYNEGVSGNTVNDLQKRFDKDVARLNPTHVVTYIGINDAGKVLTTPAPVSAAAFETGLRSIVARTQAIGAVPLLATLAIRGEKPNGQNPVDSRLDEYAQITRDVATDTGVSLIDLRPPIQAYLAKYNIEVSAYPVVTRDGVHPNSVGYRIIAERMLAVMGDRIV